MTVKAAHSIHRNAISLPLSTVAMQLRLKGFKLCTYDMFLQEVLMDVLTTPLIS